jgi:ubiquinone/menaquinone biosynthesis C-methylase UbiE
MDKSVNFNRAADFYDATRGFPEGVDKQIAAFMQKEAHLTSSMKLLEVGIGTGRIALPLAPYVDFVAGADISADMLGVLMRKRQQENVFPVETDGHYLPYANAAFDAAVLVHVLHLVPEPLRILAELARCLKSEGRLLHCLTTQDIEKPNPIIDAWTTIRPTRPNNKRWDEIQTLLKSSDWHLESEFTYWYSSIETSQQHIELIQKRAWSSTWALSDAELEEGINAIKAAVQEHHHGDFQLPIERRVGYKMQILRPPAS